ncbi:MAG: 16S rRNA (cytidine(1402)-2'-O)-methyltransferase [Paracoccaceae bacterium]|nr:16S rRNA (cytidine(1402)-2'-O)-methyltransferase [Paracoccaceae bacterium]
MNFQTKPLSAGLYFVATPIGTARDITLRALDILASADVIAAEDTRTARKLMDIHGIPLGDRPLVAYHDHSGDGPRNRIVDAISQGKSVAYASEAGTPLVADPGYALGRAVIDADLPVTSAPGPSAVLPALTISGLPTDAFFFFGFLPNAATARETELATLRDIPATLVFYESPKRIQGMLVSLRHVYGDDRPVVVCRELTKKFEEVTRGTAAEVSTAFEGRNVKGELVVLVGRATKQAVTVADVETALREAMKTMRVKDSASVVAGSLGLPRRAVYQIALGMEM